jgi:cullin-4
MSETMSQLKFPAQGSDIKKRVESLIDREYMEREESNPQMYRYLA